MVTSVALAQVGLVLMDEVRVERRTHGLLIKTARDGISLKIWVQKVILKGSTAVLHKSTPLEPFLHRRTGPQRHYCKGVSIQ